MECDKDMGLIKQNVHIEVPSDWNEHVRNSRSKPSPFTVIEAEPHMFSKWGSFLTPHYKQKCPFATRPITEIFIDKSIVRTINGRSSYNGAWESYIIASTSFDTFVEQEMGPEQAYARSLPISREK